jgi:hypothetical protein
LPLAPQHGADTQLQSLHAHPPLAPELAAGVGVETAEHLGLQPPGELKAQQLGRAQPRRRSVPVAPEAAQPVEIEALERRHLGSNIGDARHSAAPIR